MPELLQKKIDYSVVCINEFAKKKALSSKEAFLYLDQFAGIVFLEENYEAEHLLSIEDAVEDLELICKNNGGNL